MKLMSSFCRTAFWVVSHFYRSSLTGNISFWPEVAAKLHVWFRQLRKEDRYISLCVLGLKMWVMPRSQGAYEKFKIDSFKLNAHKDSIICQLEATKSSTTSCFPYIFFLSFLLKYCFITNIIIVFHFSTFCFCGLSLFRLGFSCRRA